MGQPRDPEEALAEWRRQARRILFALGSELVDTAPQAAREGRVVTGRTGRIWLNDALAFRRFGFALAKALPDPDPRAVPAGNHDNSTESEDR